MARGLLLAAAVLVAAPVPLHAEGTAVGAPPMAMQSRVRQIADEAHLRAAAGWQRLQAAPDDLDRLAASWSASWQSGDALRAITYALILLLIGGGVEWLYWCYAGGPRQAIAETAMAGNCEGALPPLEAGSLSGRRALLEACGCAAFALSTIAASSAFRWPMGVQDAVVGVVFVVTAIRLTAIAMRLLLSPDCPQLRLLPMDDPAARHTRFITLGAASLLVCGISLRALCDGPLAAPALGFAVSVSVSIVVCGFWVEGIRFWAARLRPAAHSRAVAAASAIMPFLGTAAALGALASVLLGARRLAWTIIIVFLALLVHRTARALIDAFTVHGAPAESEDDTDPRISAYRPVLRRIELLAVLGAALAALAGEWDVSMHNMAGQGPLGRLLGRALDVTVVVLLADLVWLWAKTAIDRRLAALGPQSAEPLPAEFSDSGTRLATLLPLLRKAVFVVIVAAATLISMSSLGIDIAPLLAGAGVVGIAIGFGAQTLVRDIVSGIFYLLEDAFRVGEYVEFGQIRGTVESISLRFLRLRHHRGAVHTIPFGEIRWLTNQSRDWQVMKLEFRVPFNTDLLLVKRLVRQIGEDLMQDAELGPWLIAPVKSRGVIRMEEFCMVVGIKFTARPGDGVFTLRREAYHRIRDAFVANGIRFADRHVRVELLEKPEDAALPALAGGGAEAAIVSLPTPLASAERAGGL